MRASACAIAVLTTATAAATQPQPQPLIAGATVHLAACTADGSLPLHHRRDGRVALASSASNGRSLCLVEAPPTCTSDHDCQLNGVCVSGKCDCDAAWQGDACSELALEGDGHYAYGGPDSGVTSWGGGPPVLDSATGNWTLFVTEIAEHCGLSEWGTQSTVVAATARSPAGPFHRTGLAIPSQAHNPYYAYDPSTKTHGISQIGDGG